MNECFISTQLRKTTLCTFKELYLKSLLTYLLYYRITIVILLHGINKVITYVTFK